MIPRQIRSRAVESVITFIAADPDYGSLCVDNIHRFPYEQLAQGITMRPNPRQLHVYAGGSLKTPGVSGAWSRDFEVVIEYYSPRNEKEPAIGDTAIDDEVDELANRLYVGQAPKSPGRFEDPDNVGKYITIGIKQISVSMPEIATGERAVRRFLNIIFNTRENAQGERV